MKFEYVEDEIQKPKKSNKSETPQIRVNKDELREKIVEYIGYIGNGHKQYRLVNCRSVSELKAKITGMVYKL